MIKGTLDMLLLPYNQVIPLSLFQHIIIFNWTLKICITPSVPLGSPSGLIPPAVKTT